MWRIASLRPKRQPMKINGPKMSKITKGVAAKLPTGEKAAVYKEKLEGLEADAREKKLGGWATSMAPKTESETKVENK